MRVAILGAGALGTCFALEMAQRGIQVDLYDREETCITQAGGRNEGKIHLGFVYGVDSTFRTAEKMVTGAMQFYPLLRRWLGDKLDAVAISDPFIYAVERGSLLSLQETENYFERLDARLSECDPSHYPGEVLPKVEKLSDHECEHLFNPERIVAAYRTPERSVNVGELAGLLRDQLNHSEGISFYPRSEIKGVFIQGDRVDIEFVRAGETHKKSYDVVLNALWDGRLALDEQVGLLDETPWAYRLKHAIFLKSKGRCSASAVTIIQGAYGDLVYFGQGNYYLSWYPTCMRGFSKNAILPPQEWNRNLPKEAAEQMTLDTIAHLSHYIPSLRRINLENSQDLSVAGGVIYAHAETDVSDPRSGLHKRYEPIIKSKGGYYSINPGKYTLCPYFAHKAADQVCSSLVASASIS